jgi:hypothetical protein
MKTTNRSTRPYFRSGLRVSDLTRSLPGRKVETGGVRNRAKLSTERSALSKAEAMLSKTIGATGAHSFRPSVHLAAMTEKTRMPIEYQPIVLTSLLFFPLFSFYQA